MKTIKISALIIFTFLFACSESVEDNKTDISNRDLTQSNLETDEEDIADIEEEINDIDFISKEELDPFFRQYKSKTNLPFHLDSIFMESLDLSYDSDEDNSLTGKEVKFFQHVLNNNEAIGWGEWPIEKFIEIDSLKANGGYEKYEEEIDIGMILYSTAYGITRIKINEETEMYIWAIYYSTYEACPFSSGAYYYASLFYNDILSETMMIGENTAGGDPPSMGSTYTQATFKNENKITINKTDIFEDLDDETYNTTENKTIEMKIENGKFKTISVK